MKRTQAGMPDFEYKALDTHGQLQRGTARAGSQSELVEALQGKGMSILDVKVVRLPGEAPGSSGAAARKSFSFEFMGVPERAIVFFTRQFATTIHAGLPMLRALTTLQAQTSSTGLRRILEKVIGRIQQGQSLHQAMSPHLKVFGPLYLSMLRVGEATGSMEATVSRLADILEKDFALRRKVKAAMVYPMFVLIFSLAIVYAMMVFLMPNFIPIFKNSGLNIDRDYPITKFLMQASQFCSDPRFFIWLIAIVVVLGLGMRMVGQTKRGRLFIDTLKFYFPVLSEMIRMATLTRFCRTFATLVHSGVPMMESLDHVAGSAGNELVASYIRRLAKDVESGGRISTTLARIAIFPPLLVQMVSIGEETGTLDQMFSRVADYFEQELEAAIGSMTSVLEPAMMVIIGAIVGFFIMGVILPIMGLSAAAMR
ncbi:MAG: type II secretion system F family protein [Candidatus Xenobia bacterium]